MFITDDTTFIRSVSFGPGPQTILALNGWSAAWEAWQPTFELLSATTRCISFDTRGTGASSAPIETITLANLVDDVFRVLDAHQVERCVLAGESLGGFIALNAVLRDRSRFDGLVLIAAPPFVTAEATSARCAAARADYPAAVSAFVDLCFSEPGIEPLHRWGEQLFLGADGETAARLFEACHGAVPDLSSVDVPTVVVHGDADQVVPIDIGRYLASAIRGARLIELEGIGHAPTVTAAPDVARVLRGMAVSTSSTVADMTAMAEC